MNKALHATDLPNASARQLQPGARLRTAERTSCSSLPASKAACCSLPPRHEMRNPLLPSGRPAVLPAAKYLRFLLAAEPEAPSCWFGRFFHWPLP